MSQKTYINDAESLPESQIGTSLEVLSDTINSRRFADETSYTFRLLNDNVDSVLKKVVEEASEVALAAKDASVGSDADVDHLRYESADLIYHLMVVLARFDISTDELAAELNTRMTDAELAQNPGMIRLKPEHVKRGK